MSFQIYFLIPCLVSVGASTSMVYVDTGCKGDPNAKYVACPSYCPRTCDDPNDSKPCIAACAPPGCICKPGYILSTETRKCIKPDECPPKACNGDPNAVYCYCRSYCPRTCLDSDYIKPCIAACAPSGCACKFGYIISHETGNCVKPENCPPKGCKGDPNAVHSACPSYCPLTCDQPDRNGTVCIAACAPPGCVCKPGYVLGKRGNCIKHEECSAKGCNSDPNAVHSDCPSNCPRTCSTDDDQVCNFACAPPGCVCKPGYVISDETGKCIMENECPVKGCNGDPNAVHSVCPSYCPLTCDQPDPNRKVCISACAPPGCVCKPGYIISNVTGKCVKPESCPPKGCKGDPNAVYSACPSYCPLTCDQPDNSGMACIAACAPPGCVCKPGYLLDKRGKCVKFEECPAIGCKGDPNAIYSDCPSYCPRTCNSDEDQVCIAACAPPGCACKPGYVISDKTGKCIIEEECPPKGCKGDPNAVYSVCPSYCPLTCDQPDLSGTACITACAPPGCVCKSGYLLDKRGKCVKPEQCLAKGCQGDPNAVHSDCPSYCPRTCSTSDDEVCIAACAPPGCVCKPGYVISEETGKCIKEDQCPPKGCKGDPNAVYSDCPSYCPRTCIDFGMVKPCVFACAPPGCLCKPGYIISHETGKCGKPENCPQPYPKCGVNEIARYCRRVCPPQTCESRLELYNCSVKLPCERGCDCLPNYLRNRLGICVRADRCDAPLPKQCLIPKKCIRTCASPNPFNCQYKTSLINRDGCECKEGFILSQVGGVCIRIEDCPIEQGCNGDLHARTKQCPLPCPSTCDSPNATPCKKMCEPIGCECEPGYIFCKESGKCILPNDCPGGNPCGVNEEFRQCRYNCPQDYCPVDDSRDTAVCDPWPVCMSGCVCKLNHRRLSQEDDRCVVASDCPPVNCTRPNEVWNGCPSDCFSGYCEDKEYQDVVCNTLLLNCQPKCVCKRDYFRNGSDICVPESKCNGCKGDPNAEFNECPSLCPLTCDQPEPSEVCLTGCGDPGCVCKEGYVRNDENRCVHPEECQDGCKGDPNAKFDECPTLCPLTCEQPDRTGLSCPLACAAPGCVCKEGFVLSGNKTCVELEDCPDRE